MSHTDTTYGHKPIFVHQDNSTKHSISTTGGHILLAHAHTATSMTAAPVTSSNNGGHCHFFVSTNTIKMVDSADGAERKDR